MPVIPNESGTHWCSICGAPYTEWGHSAYPVNTGRCCNECNDLTVIPARIRAMRKVQKDSAADLNVTPPAADEAPVSVNATEPGPARTSWANPHDKKGQSE